MCVSLQQADRNKQVADFVDEIGKGWLTAKEKRAYLYIINGGSRIIGDMCRALHTTPFTLLGKTLPGLEAKGLIK